jgi:mannose-1-phosphate guanylyltransferase
MPTLKAVILVGGPGIRLRPLTEDRPKSVVPVLNRPYMEHTISHFKKYGIKDIILAMNYLPDAIREYFDDGERCGVHLTYCLEKEPLGTAGAVKNAAEYLDGPIIVLNGDDVFLEMNWDEAYAFHTQKKAISTILLKKVDNPSAFGVVETDAEHKVRRFIEKPPPGTETTNWINAGGYILEPEVLTYIPSGQHYMFEKELFPYLLETCKPVYGYEYKGYWKDMGTPANYFNLNMDMLEGKVKSPLFDFKAKDVIYKGKGVKIDKSAVLSASVVIGNGCRIGAGVKIKGPAIIGQDCRLEDGAVVENAVLWDNIIVGVKTSLAHCIVVSRAVIDGHQEVEDSIITPAQTVPLPR